MKMGRRMFLKWMAAMSLTGMAAYVGCNLRSSDKRGQPERGSPIEGGDVVVIGAGLSGLVAAYLLSGAGKRVTVLESHPRPGGRVHTYRWPNGQVSEVGFEEFFDPYVDADVWWLIGELGLGHQIVPYPQSIAAHLRDQFVPEMSWERWVHALPWSNPSLDARGFLAMSDHISDGIGYLWAPGREEDYKSYDHEAMRDWTTRNFNGSGSGDVDWISSIFLNPETGVPSDQSSAAFSIASFWVWYNASTFHLRDGNEQLISSLVERLPEESLRVNSPVTSVRNTGDGMRVEVEYEDEAGPQLLVADAVVVAVPHTAIPGMVVDFPEDRIESLRRLRHSRVIRPDYQFSERVWQTEFGFNGMGVYTDGIPTWIASLGSKGYDTGILAAYVNEPKASQHWTSVDEGSAHHGVFEKSAEAPISDAVLGEITQYWPGLEQNLVEARVWQIPYYGPVFSPNYLLDGYYALNQEPFGRITFAGDWVYGFGASDAIQRGKDVAELLQ